MTRGHLLHVKLGATRRSRSMERNHLGPQQVLAWGNAGRDGNCVYAGVVNNLRCAPVAPVVTVLLDLEPTRRYVSARPICSWRFSSLLIDNTHHPLPTPVSVKALSTFFRYANVGPLWDASITSLGPESKVCLQMAFTVDPACTVMMLLADFGSLGGPLQVRLVEVTSWMGPS